MAVNVQCPNAECGKRYSVNESHLGRDVVCRACGRRFTLSAASAETPDFSAAADTHKTEMFQLAGDLPQRIGRFEIRRRLGAGGFGVVYRGYDPVLDREVAIKVPHPAFVQSEECRVRMMVEARAAGQLRHPNIVPVHEAGVDGELYYIASAFIEGRTLDHVLQERKLPFATVTKLAMDLAGALDYAHRSGVIHRDVKPSNIILDASGDPLLMDFGLARLKESESKLTREGSLLGTPAYMSPEQARREQDRVGPASDQYSLGVVLYELLCGRAPFSGPPALVISMVANQTPPPPRSADPQIPRDLETICLKAMAAIPHDRYANCQELADDLRRWREGDPIAARRLNVLERGWRWCRRNPVVAGLSATAVVLLVSVAVVASIGYVQTSIALNTAARERNRAELALKREAAARENAEREKQRAEEAYAKEAAARENAEREKQRAEEALAKLEAERQRTAQLSDEVTRKESTVERERLKALKSLYYNNLAQAWQHWLSDDVVQAAILLRDCPAEMRHWEWGYLTRLCDPESLSLAMRATPSDHVTAVDVIRIALSADGGSILMATRDGAVSIYDAATGKVSRALRRGAGSAPRSSRPYSFSPRLAHPSSLERGRGAGESDTWLCCAAFSSGGDSVVLASSDGTVEVLSATTGKEVLARRPAVQDLWRIDCVAVNATGDRIALGVEGMGNRSSVKVWDAKTGQELLCLGDTDSSRPQPSKFPRTFLRDWLAFSPDGKQLAAVCHQAVTVWDAASGRETITLGGLLPPRITCVAFGPTGDRIVSAADDGTVRVWDVATGQAIFTLTAHGPGVTQATFDPAGRRIASVGSDGQLKIWDALEGRELLTLRGGWDAIADVAFSAAGHSLAAAVTDRDGCALQIWSRTPDRVQTLRPSDRSGWANAVAFSSDGTKIAVASDDVELWEVATLTQLSALVDNSGGIHDVAFSPDGRYIASTERQNNIVKVWDAATKQTLWTMFHGSFLARGRTATCVAFDPDGAFLLTAGDRILQLRDFRNRKELLLLRRHDGLVTSATFSPDGKRIASASEDKTVKIWDATTGRELATLPGHGGRVNDVAFSPDGKHIASASEDKTAKVWDAATGRELMTLSGHAGDVFAVGFSPDGARLASASKDRTVILWETTTGQQVFTLRDAGESVRDVTFSPDGKKIAAAIADRTVKIWTAQAW